MRQNVAEKHHGDQNGIRSEIVGSHDIALHDSVGAVLPGIRFNNFWRVVKCSGSRFEQAVEAHKIF